ncbi:MAG: hypothetical protein WC515_03485 [Candidatus Omnitrophota bacterium]
MTDRKGTILVASLWILSILSIMAVGIGFRTSLEARLSKYNLDRMKSLYLARAGSFRSLEAISADGRDYDSMRECGIMISDEYGPEAGPSVFFSDIRAGDGTFSVGYTSDKKYYAGMSDEARRININTAPAAVLERLLGPGNEEVASYVIDWRDTDAITARGESEDAYYQSLEHPYRCKNGNFLAPEELFMVRGMTPEIFYNIKEYITVFGEGKININTAPPRVLLASGLSESTADIITRFRAGPDGIYGTGDDGIFRSDGNIQNDSIFTGTAAADKETIRNSFTIKSEYFRIESTGRAENSKAEKLILAVVQKNAAGGTHPLKSYREY